ncbi:RNA-directed DNA polymerase, eukaryota [Tanacetum coccineum]
MSEALQAQYPATEVRLPSALLVQKAKVRWAIEGDENSKYFHGIINKKRSNLAIRGVFVDGTWCTDPILVKKAFKDHYEARFNKPTKARLKLSFSFRIGYLRSGCRLERHVVSWMRLDWRARSLWVALCPNTQSAFVAGRQILDGPFILNEVLDWCKRKKKKALFFKVDFAKAYDSVRWDFLLDVLEAFGFVNGSPSDEFHIHRGLKQGDPLSPFLFILVMEALHLSVCKAVDEDINIHKSQILGVGVSRSRVEDMASSLGCTIMENKFRYLGVMVGAGMTRHKAWDDCERYALAIDDVVIPSILRTRWEVLHRVCRWWEIDFQLWRSFSEWDEWFSSIRLPGSVKGFLEGVFYVAWWFIWGFRNRSTFDVNKPSRSILFENIVSSSFLWCNSRCSRKFSRDDWLKNPHLISL